MFLAVMKYHSLLLSRAEEVKKKKAQLYYNNKREASGTLGELFDYFTDVKLRVPFMTTIQISQMGT